jgi:hypothetical protein
VGGTVTIGKSIFMKRLQFFGAIGMLSIGVILDACSGAPPGYKPKASPSPKPDEPTPYTGGNVAALNLMPQTEPGMEYRIVEQRSEACDIDGVHLSTHSTLIDAVSALGDICNKRINGDRLFHIQEVQVLGV